MPGIGFSPDKVLQARVFSYADAHRYRLGTHYEALPVNAPICPVHNYHKDGVMNFFGHTHGSDDAFYEPNSFDGPKQDASVAEPPMRISGDADRFNHRDGNDDYSQPRALHDLMDAGQQGRLYMNTAQAMQGVPEPIINHVLGHYDQISQAYGNGIRAARAELSGAAKAAQ